MWQGMKIWEGNFLAGLYLSGYRSVVRVVIYTCVERNEYARTRGERYAYALACAWTADWLCRRASSVDGAGQPSLFCGALFVAAESAPFSDCLSNEFSHSRSSLSVLSRPSPSFFRWPSLSLSVPTRSGFGPIHQTRFPPSPWFFCRPIAGLSYRALFKRWFASNFRRGFRTLEVDQILPLVINPSTVSDKKSCRGENGRKNNFLFL